jgi:predicted secreted hydrolase
MDHEFGSNQLGSDQVGWDWFCLQLDDDRELMLYILRLRDGRLEPHSNGTLIEADGSWRDIPLPGFSVTSVNTWRSRRSGAVYPSGWRVRVPVHGIDLTVSPSLDDQELITRGPPRVIYWEGSVRAEGKSAGKAVSGIGYVELTGYAAGSRPEI